MACYRLLDGITICANNPNEFVNQLRSSSFFPCDTTLDYMAEFAKRVYVLYSTNISSSNCDDFLGDLIKLNLVYIIQIN